MMTLLDYLPEFVDALREQLEGDQKRWGDTWKKRGREGQEQRFFTWMHNIIDQYENAGTPVPWMKIAGEALIGWARENKTNWK